MLESLRISENRSSQSSMQSVGELSRSSNPVSVANEDFYTSADEEAPTETQTSSRSPSLKEYNIDPLPLVSGCMMQGIAISKTHTSSVTGTGRRTDSTNDIHTHPAGQEVNERTALLNASNTPIHYESALDTEAQCPKYTEHSSRNWLGTVLQTVDYVKVVFQPEAWSRQAVWKKVIVRPASLLPAVFIGVLLNMLDALSYGMILFPLGHSVFDSLGPDGISVFYVSTIIAQVTYSSGGSHFCGGLGSEMIEVLPFFHEMALIILAKIGEDNTKSVLATTVVSYALSAVMTGIAFFLMGIFKLGRLTAFFPQHVLLGCIGGVGWFLMTTGIKVSTGLNSDMAWQHLCVSDTIPLWLVPLGLAFVLMITQRYVKSSFLLGGCFVTITAIFYLVKFQAQIPMATLRHNNWVFEAASGTEHQWYHFYTLYNFKAVDWSALIRTLPTMLALTFFSVLHVPINIPSLSISTGEADVNMDREFVAHGVSNCLSGLFGSVQNYLVYSNSLLFIKSGGDDRLAGLILAATTFGILLTSLTVSVIGYVPTMVVGALIFLLGLELLAEALVYTWKKVYFLEYITIVVVVAVIALWDFTGGILLGIIIAALHSLTLISQSSVVQAIFSSDEIKSTEGRSRTQLERLHETRHQIRILKLGGNLFFGTIPDVEQNVRSLVDQKISDSWSSPLTYLILDIADVSRIDFSAAQGLMRINGFLKKHDVQYAISGLDINDKVGHALYKVGLMNRDQNIWVFKDISEATRVCEDQLLTTQC